MSHPEPIIRARPCPAEMLPDSAALLIRRAEALGFRTQATIAIGWHSPPPGKPLGKPIRDIIVKIQKSDVLLVGTWENGKFRRGYRVPGRLGLPDRISANELKKEVSS